MTSTTDRRGSVDPWEQLLPGGRDAEEAPDRVENGRHRPTRVPLLSVPTSLRSLQLEVAPTAVRGVLVLVVVAALVLAGRWVWVTQWSDPVPQHRLEASHGSGPQEKAEEAVSGAAEGAVSGAAEGATSGASEGATSGASEGHQAPAGDDVAAGTGSAGTPGDTGAAAPPQRLTHLVVHVTGQVGTPGVVTLPQGSRVVDAVQAAGGLTSAADQASLNLARQLTDGEQLWVGRPGEEPPPGLDRQGRPAEGGDAGSGDETDGAAALLVDLNTATEAQLDELPGVGPVTAGRILAWREEHGRFSVPEELLEVSGIGERTLEQLRPHVTVGG